MPAVIAHLTAMCRARQDKGVTADVQATSPGRYVITICNRRKTLSLTFTRRRRRWDLTDVQMTEDGKPVDAARSMYEVIRLLSDHEIGTGTPPHPHAANGCPATAHWKPRRTPSSGYEPAPRHHPPHPSAGR